MGDATFSLGLDASSSGSGRDGSQDPSYLTVLDCTTVVLTLSGNDVSWVTLWIFSASSSVNGSSHLLFLDLFLFSFFLTAEVLASLC